ncbi:MAG: hypothetical protein ACRELC_03155 [Gemmatimonadota bacterium]
MKNRSKREADVLLQLCYCQGLSRAEAERVVALLADHPAMRSETNPYDASERLLAEWRRRSEPQPMLPGCTRHV